MDRPKTLYAAVGDAQVAYQVFGQVPPAPTLRRRLVDLDTVITELDRILARLWSLAESPEQSDPTDALERARKYARQYASKADELEKARRRAEEDERMAPYAELCRELTIALSSYDDDFRAIREELAERVGVSGTVGGPVPLSDLAARGFLEPAGVSAIAVQTGQFEPSLPAAFQSGACGVVVIGPTQEILPRPPTLYVGAYIHVSERDVWLLRAPILRVIDESPGHATDRTPPILTDRYGRLVGPRRLGLASTLDEIRAFGNELGGVGLELAAEWLRLVVEGRDLTHPDSWTH
jgi:hypothetical protein